MKGSSTLKDVDAFYDGYDCSVVGISVHLGSTMWLELSCIAERRSIENIAILACNKIADFVF